MKVAHILPLSLSLYGLDDKDIGETSRFFFTNICEFESRLGLSVIGYMISSSSGTYVKSCPGYQVVFVPADFEPRVQKHKFGHQISFRLVFRVLLQRPDVIHFHGFMQHHLMYAIFTITSKMFRIKVIGHHQGITKKRFIEDLFTKLADKLVDEVIVTNLDTKACIKRERPSLQEKTLFIPNGVDQTIFYPTDKTTAKLQLHLEPSDFVLLWVGRLMRPQKDAFTVIKAINRLRSQSHNSIKLVIVGQGEDEGKLKEFAYTSGNGGRNGVIFVTDYVRHDDLRVFYNAADAFVLNSSHEGMPQVALEAMACKTPVILSDVAGNREIADKVGLLFEQNNSERLANCIYLLAKDGLFRRSLGEKGYNKIINGYTWERISNIIVRDVYNYKQD